MLSLHNIISDLYSFLFCAKAKLAKKTKPWRISLFLEVTYGGWTLVRDAILSAFPKYLLNLIDNYVPLVLSIYSVVFKCSNYDFYCQSLFCCWTMMMIFHRRHYDKALLIVLSTFKYWQENTHPVHDIIQQFLVALDEYPVENFHSVLRARTDVSDTAEQIREKAKEIDACKKEMHEFQSSFVPPRKFNFSRKRIESTTSKQELQNCWSASLRPSIPILVEQPNNHSSHGREKTLVNGSYQICLAIKWLPIECSHLDSLQWKSHLTQKGKLVKPKYTISV